MKDNNPKEDKASTSFSVSTRPDKPIRANKSSIAIDVPEFSMPKLKKPDTSKIKMPDWQSWKSWNSKVLIALIIVFCLLSGYIGAWFQTRNDNGNVTFSSLGSKEKIITSQSQLINAIAKSVGPSVVSVNVDITSTGSNTTGGFGLYGFSQPEQEQAAGTGIILTSDGLIVTNRHVVPVGTTNVSITLSDGTEFKNVSIIGRTNANDSLDIAFLKINDLDGHKLTPAIIGDSSQVQVGDAVVAIGNALGQFQNTVTSGIISGYGRSVTASSSTGSSSENLADLFQTDAAINEGNSGGPLVDMNGQVIGINTATASSAQNIGFSIPINDVKGLINQVIKTGKFATPYLGVRYIPLTADVANEYNLSVDNGAFIAPSSDSSEPSVIPGSPADQAGLQTNDIITGVNGVAIDQYHSLTSLLDQFDPGAKVTLTVVRGSNTISVPVTLGSEPSD